MRDDEFESRVAWFEQTWRVHGPCRIADALRDPTSLDAAERTRLLIELICIDLEFRWRNGRVVEPVTLGGYIEKFPELVSIEQLPIEIVGEEYRARRRWGDAPSHPAFMSRFRERHELIRAALVRVDNEIEAELGRPTPPPPIVSSHSNSGEDTHQVPGSSLFSHRDFLLRRLIGAGRMGKVYEAGQKNGERDVAVKYLRKSLLHHPEVVQRFLGEARTIAGLHHPNIVRTRGLGRATDNAYFIVMDLVRGPNLAVLAGRRVIQMEEAIRWTIETCDALAYAHQQGVVHCDLKPANLLLDEDWSIRVADFGLARSLAGATPWVAEVEGTAPFMAPEQASRFWGPIDHRTDIYGVGAVLFALLTGRPPLTGRRLPDILAQVISATPIISPASLRPDLPASVSQVCRRCLSKAPASRFENMHEVRSHLVRI